MIVVTTNDVPGYRIDAILGEVMGMTVRAANIGQNFTASFRAIGGGEVTEYTQLVYASREEVMARMSQQAQQRGANAVIGMRFDTGDIGQAFSEVCAYGTAAVVTPLGEGEDGATKQSVEQARQPQPQPQPQPVPVDQPAPPQGYGGQAPPPAAGYGAQPFPPQQQQPGYGQPPGYGQQPPGYTQR